MIAFKQGYMGWLGNQMFQYAATRALGLRHNLPTHFPSNSPDIHRVFQTQNVDLQSGSYTGYSEKSFSYNTIPLTSSFMLLSGYFQSEKYFKDQERAIRKEFRFRNPQFEEDHAINAISLHVRRGDYLKYPESLPLCPVSYYDKALELVPDKEVIVFSDDIDWCKETFKGDRFSFSEGRTAEQDLEYMSKCDTSIIANSSFSWWGAWLGETKKQVIAPKNWFGPAIIGLFPEGTSTADVPCRGWEVI